jgi:hypothetical protein
MSFSRWLRALFGAPSQHDPARYGIVAVHFPPGDWSSWQHDAFREQLARLDAVGPLFGVTIDAAAADVIVRHWEAPADGREGAARYHVGTRTVEIDPVLCAGRLELQCALAHEILHALGCAHVRHDAGDRTPDCSPVGTGVAILNARLGYDAGEIAYDAAFTGPVACVTPSHLDLAEFARAHSGRAAIVPPAPRPYR